MSILVAFSFSTEIKTQFQLVTRRNTKKPKIPKEQKKKQRYSLVSPLQDYKQHIQCTHTQIKEMTLKSHEVGDVQKNKDTK